MVNFFKLTNPTEAPLPKDWTRLGCPTLVVRCRDGTQDLYHVRRGDLVKGDQVWLEVLGGVVLMAVSEILVGTGAYASNERMSACLMWDEKMDAWFCIGLGPAPKRDITPDIKPDGMTYQFAEAQENQWDY